MAEHDGMIVGHVWVEVIEKIPNPLPEAEWHAYLTNLYVDEMFRGGVGSRLISSVLDWCRQEEVEAVILWPTKQSRSLYARHGFQDCGPVMLADLTAAR